MIRPAAEGTNGAVAINLPERGSCRAVTLVAEVVAEETATTGTEIMEMETTGTLTRALRVVTTGSALGPQLPVAFLCCFTVARRLSRCGT